MSALHNFCRIPVILIALIVFLNDHAVSQIKLSDGIYVDGYIRYRAEWDGRDFDSNTDMDTYSTLRTRLGFKAENIVENTVMYLMLGDSRTLGFEDPYLSGSHIGPNRFDNNVGAVQAYLEISDFFHPHLTLKLGRMENNMGRGRFFGPGNWNHNGPRTFDGFSLMYRTASASARFFNYWGYGGDRYWAEPGSNTDHYLSGIDWRFMKDSLQFLMLWDHDNKEILCESDGKYNDRLSLITLLGYYIWNNKSKGGNFWSLTIDAAYQLGNRGSVIGEADISAYMFVAGLSYTLLTPKKPWLGLAVDITSGDDGSDPGKNKYFQADYFSKHGSQGHMDYFKSVASKSLGLQDFIVRCGFAPMKQGSIAVDFHTFRYQESYISKADGQTANAIGYEIDTKTNYTLRKGLSLIYGLDVFFPSDDWGGIDADTALFSYLSFTLQF